MTARLSRTGRKILFPLFISGLMVSCSPFNPFGLAQDYLDIAKLDEISNQRTVNVQGIVVNVAPFLEGGAYQIQDKTGRVWVKTDRQLPKKGTVLSIRGEVAFEPIFIGPEKLGESYLVETTSPRPQATASTGTESQASTVAVANESSTGIEVIEESAESTATSGETTTETVVEVEEAMEEVTEITEIEAVTTEESPATANGAANLMPPSQASPPANNSIPVANPEAPRPIAGSVTAPTATQTRPNFDDQFLPYKRFAK